MSTSRSATTTAHRNSGASHQRRTSVSFSAWAVVHRTASLPLSHSGATPVTETAASERSRCHTRAALPCPGRQHRLLSNASVVRSSSTTTTSDQAPRRHGAVANSRASPLRCVATCCQQRCLGGDGALLRCVVAAGTCIRSAHTHHCGHTAHDDGGKSARHRQRHVQAVRRGQRCRGLHGAGSGCDRERRVTRRRPLAVQRGDERTVAVGAPTPPRRHSRQCRQRVHSRGVHRKSTRPQRTAPCVASAPLRSDACTLHSTR
jgi:hypothetical protein